MEFENIGYIFKASDFRKYEESQRKLNDIEWAKSRIKKGGSKICLLTKNSSINFSLTPEQREQVLNFIYDMAKKEAEGLNIQQFKNK